MWQSRTLWTAGVYNFCDRLLSQTHKSSLISKSVFSFAPPHAVTLGRQPGRPLPVFANISLTEQMDLRLFVHAGPFRQPEGAGIHTARRAGVLVSKWRMIVNDLLITSPCRMECAKGWFNEPLVAGGAIIPHKEQPCTGGLACPHSHQSTSAPMCEMLQWAEFPLGKRPRRKLLSRVVGQKYW